MAAIYHIEMLGGLRVRHGDRNTTRFRTRKTGELLAYLACDCGRMHTREHLIELFFPELDPAAARNNLSQHLGFLRRQLEPSPFPAGSVLSADRLAVSLNPLAVTTDIVEFESHLIEAQRALSERTQILHLSDALTLYAGPLLPDVYADWALAARERLARQRLQTLRSLARLLVKTGELNQALSVAQQVVSADPLLEEGHRDLMSLYVATGQPALAVRQYQEMEHRLRAELGIDPSPMTRRLLAEIQERLTGTGTRTPAPDPPRVSQAAPAPPSRKPTEAPRSRGGSHAPFVTPPPTSGTVTFLLLDFSVSEATADRALSETISAQTLVRLQAELRRHGGAEMRAPKGLLTAAFGRASDAGLCALAIRDLFASAAAPGSPRLALDTREIRLKDGEEPARILEFGMRLLGAIHPGQIVCSEATAILLRREPIECLKMDDLGRYRLVTHEAAQRVFQLSDRDTTQGFPPLRASSGDLVALPPTVTRFFGREGEIARLLTLLSDASVRLVTLLGPGGTGKTRLALEAVSRLGESAGRLVRWVDLADVSDPLRLPGALVTALGLSRSPTRTDLDLVIEAVRAQPTLLVLDNFEQLVEDGGAETVQTLLAAARSLQLLVTSRTALELVSERRFEVLPLPVPKQGAGCWVSGVEKQDARIEAPLSPGAQRPIPGLRSAHSDTRHPTPGTLLSIPSIALFVDRAQAVRPDFQLGSHNADAVMALCVRLEGIPLAIELAAARTQLLSPSQMLAQLEDRFAFLVSRRRDIPSRHRTLRATLEWSARLLSPELHRRLARLSVFRGGWTIETATEVCAESLDILESLEVLCNSSLTVAEETPEGGIRFRMLETIREFAAEILETSDEAEQIRTRHANWCLRLVNSAHKASTGPDQQMWLDRLELEHDNLRAALTWRLKCPLDSEDRDPLPALTLLRLCAVLPNFWWTRGYLDEGRAWCAAALDRAGAASRTSDRGDVLSGAGVLALRQGDYAAARAYFEECLSIRRELGHAQGISYALNNLGMLACDEGDYKAAHTYYAESLSIKRELGDQKAVAGTLNNMGMVAQSLGDFAAAETQYREALHINRELGNRAFEANNLNNMGIAAELQGDLSTARGYYEESLPIRQALGDRWGIAYSLYCLGHLDCLLKNYRSAEDHLQESLTIRKEVGHRPGIAQSLSALAELAVALSMASEDEQAVWLPTEADTIDMLVRHAVPLWSAASALRHEIGDRLSTWEQEALDRKIAAVRERIGPADFDAAWSAGQAMSMDQAIASAQSTRLKLVD